MGYTTAGESIDPNDWNLVRPDANGGTHRLRPDEIVSEVLAQADVGHAILLHDAGGDRSATVKALPALIDALRARLSPDHHRRPGGAHAGSDHAGPARGRAVADRR